MLAAFVCLLLALPALAAHWFERYGVVDHLAAALFGAAAGWFLMTLVLGSTPILAVAGAVVGGAVALGLTLRHDAWVAGEAQGQGRQGP